MKVFITKNCLSDGIVEREVEQDKQYPYLVCWKEIQGAWSCYASGDGKQWHRTIESARSKAEATRKKRIDSLKKQIAKLEALKF
jgi:hypothetical protein